MNVIVVRTNDTYQIVNINNDYRELQNIVGGLIEPVHPTIAYQTEMLLPGTLFIVDEEGLLKEKALNSCGTVLYNGNALNYYPIVGDLILIAETIDMEDFRGFIDEEIDQFKVRLKAFGIKEVSTDGKED